MNKNLDFIKNNVLDKKNVYNNILVPFCTKINVKPTEYIISDSIKTIKKIDMIFIFNKAKGDLNTMNNMIINILVNKAGVLNNTYKSDGIGYVMSIMNNTVDDDTGFSASGLYHSQETTSSASSSSNQGPNGSNGSFGDMNTSLQGMIQMAKVLNLNSLKRDAKAYINTRYKNIILNDNTAFSFNLVNKGNTNNLSGDIPLGINIKNIIGFKLTSFTIPFININSNRGLINLSIDEMTTDGFSSFSNIITHFVFKYTEQTSNSLLLTPEFDGEITFINSFNVNTLTFRFSDGFNYIPLPSERLTASNINYTNSYFVFDSEHGLISGDIIYVSGFTTLTPVVDYNIISNVNANKGIVVNTINSTTIQLVNIDLSTISQPDLNNKPIVYLDYRIIQFPLIIKYINDTNF